MSFTHVGPATEITELESQTLPHGRFYKLPDGAWVPSVTTVVGHQSKQGILDWEKRVGFTEAQKIRNAASWRGTKYHGLVEFYLNNELEKIEKPAGISNPKDFRNEIVNFVLRARANNNGVNPQWSSYEKLKAVIEKKMFSNTEDLLPVISFNTKSSSDDKKKHDDFVERMCEKGYTQKQVRLLCEWYLRVRKSA